MTPSLLRAIVASTEKSLREKQLSTPLNALEELASISAEFFQREPRALLNTLVTGQEPRVIAECKRRSPSKGVLRRSYDAAPIARAYQDAGAAAISILTEPTFFDGNPLDITHARIDCKVSVPILRKDFIVSPYQIPEAVMVGADAVLLIVGALDDRQLADLLAAAAEWKLDALVEVHDGDELSRALDAGARLIGVNSRNLHTLQVDTRIFAQLATRFPKDVIAVAESGLSDGATVRELASCGYRGFLIGERFMTEDDPGAALATLLADARQRA